MGYGNDGDESFNTEKRKYSRISIGTRKKLINMVLQQKITLTRASKHLKIKTTTAKMILKAFVQKGRIFSRKSEKEKMNSIQIKQTIINTEKQEKRQESIGVQEKENQKIVKVQDNQRNHSNLYKFQEKEVLCQQVIKKQQDSGQKIVKIQERIFYPPQFFYSYPFQNMFPFSHFDYF